MPSLDGVGLADRLLVEFSKRRAGMIHALDGGVWFHRHKLNGERMAHVISSNKGRLLRFGKLLGMRAEWLQYKPLKDPRTGSRVAAWHWDLRRDYLDKALSLPDLAR